MLNRVINSTGVYYKVADLADVYGASVYAIRKAIKDQNIETKKDIFGRIVFVEEKQLANLVVHGAVKVLKTEVNANPVTETNIVDQKAFDKNEKRKANKKSAESKKTEGIEVKKEAEGEVCPSGTEGQDSTEVKTDTQQTNETQPEPDEQQERQNLLERHAELRLHYLTTQKGGLYNELYKETIGDDIKIEDIAPNENESIKRFIKMLEIEKDNTTYIEPIMFETPREAEASAVSN